MIGIVVRARIADFCIFRHHNLLAGGGNQNRILRRVSIPPAEVSG